MPNRIIRDGNLDSARMDALSEQAELFYRRLWSVVDDYGRFEYDPLVLLAKTWPRRIHRYTPDQVDGWTAECTQGIRPLVILYEVNGKRYMQVQEFDQRIRRTKTGELVPSKFPGPEEAASAARGFSPRVAARATTAAASTHTTTTPEAQQELFPETARVVQELHPGADLAPKLAAAAAEIQPGITDSELAEVLVRTHLGKRQQSAGLWLRTVPTMLRQLTPRPPTAESPQEMCGTCGEPGLCECRKRQIDEMFRSVSKPPGSEVHAIGAKTRRGGAT